MDTGEYRGFAGRFPQRRLRIALARWRWPVFLSLAVHSLLFLPYSETPDAAGSAAALVLSELRVDLRLSEQPVPPTKSSRSAPPTSSVSPMPRAVPVSTPGATLNNDIGARRLAVLRSATPVPPVVAEGAEVRQSTAEEAVALPVPVMHPPISRSPRWETTPGLDAGALRAYRLAVARSMRMSQWRSGLAVGEDGRVSVGVAMSATGQLGALEVTHGSGRMALDQAVLMAVRRALADVSLPLPLQGKTFVFLLEVEVDAAVARENAVISGAGQ